MFLQNLIKRFSFSLTVDTDHQWLSQIPKPKSDPFFTSIESPEFETEDDPPPFIALEIIRFSKLLECTETGLAEYVEPTSLGHRQRVWAPHTHLRHLATKGLFLLLIFLAFSNGWREVLGVGHRVLRYWVLYSLRRIKFGPLRRDGLSRWCTFLFEIRRPRGWIQ